MQKNVEAVECKKECEALDKEYTLLKRNLKSALSAFRKSLKALNKRGCKLRRKADKVMFDKATSKELVKGAVSLANTMEDIENMRFAVMIDDVIDNWND